MKTFLKIAAGLAGLVIVLGGVLGWLVMGNQQPMPARQEVAPGVVSLRDGFVGVGVVRTESGKLVLIDAGNDPAAKVILQELEERHLKPDDVWAIFLTHGHPDHRKGVQAFPKAAVYILGADRDLVLGKVKANGPLTQFFPAEDDHVHLTRTLRDGETVTFDGVDVKVFELPGHTPGSAAYLASGVLFLGDGANFTKYGRLAGPKWIFTDDPRLAETSLRTLAHRLEPLAGRIKAVVTSHSGAALNGFKSMQSYLAEP